MDVATTIGFVMAAFGWSCLMFIAGRMYQLHMDGSLAGRPSQGD